MPAITRRGLLTISVAAMTGAASAEVLRPLARPAPIEPSGARPPGRPVLRPGTLGPADSARILAEIQPSGEAAYAVVDTRSGALLDGLQPDRRMTPASVTKIFTALYARDRLGPGYRFATRIHATGPVQGGVLRGDLVLSGGGDPGLDTDHLAALAQRLARAGLRGVAGRFLVWPGALPALDAIDAAQDPQLAYNPAVSGLNLNYNRVHFEWARRGGTWQTTLDARTETHHPTVSMAEMDIVDRAAPLYTYRDGGDRDLWTVAQAALDDGGSRWLPVRKPAIYAGDVFRSLAAEAGITLPEPVVTPDPPAGPEVMRHLSPRLDVIIAGMLEHSTNLTAEVLGLTATRAGGALPPGLATSAAQMGRWARDAFGGHPRFADHSGLGPGTAVTATDLCVALVSAGRAGALPGLLKSIPLLNAAGDPITPAPALIRAKTGTLNFVSALAGYPVTPRRQMAFAIFLQDLPRRADAAGDELPDGLAPWLRDARRAQQALLRHWAGTFG